MTPTQPTPSARRARRKRAAVVCFAAGAVLLAEPFVYRSEAASAPARTGTSSVTLALPSVSVTDPVGGNRSLSLGAITAGAQSTPSLGATLSLGNLAALGRTVPGVSYSSAQGTKSGNATVPLSAGPVSGSVGLVNYLVQAANGTATASLGALNGQLSAAPLGIGAALGQHGLSTQVTPTGSDGAVQLTSPGLTIKLSDLLPANVLNALPLGTLLKLLQTTGVPLGSTLGAQVNQLESAILGVQVLSGDLTQLAGAQSTVNSLLASNPALTAAQQAVTTAQQALTSQQSTVSSLQSQLSTDQATQATDQAAQTAACVIPLSPTCTAAQAALTTINGTVSSDQTKLSAAQATLTSDQSALAAAQAALTSLVNQAAAPGSPLATAQGLVSSLTTTIDNLLSQLQGVLSGLPNLQSLRQQLSSALGNAPLLQVGNVSVQLSTAADAKSGTSSVTCTLGSVTVLGVSVAAPTCASLTQALAGIEGQLAGVLDLLPTAAKPAVTIDGLTPTSTATSAPSATGATSASAGLSALHLGIAPISLSGLVDSLTSQLQSQVNQVLSGLGVAAPAVKTGAVRSHALTLPAGLSGALTTLATQVGALPTGSALAGLSTIGLDAHLVGVSSQASYQGGSTATTAATGTTPAAAAPTGSSTPVKKLPFTGANELALLAAGLLLVVAGAQLLAVRRVAENR